MALQDDIMAMLSQISDAGDRATDRGRRGEELYGQIANRLSGDNRSKALREIAMLTYSPDVSIEEQMRFDPLTGSRVADIIEKYMDDVEDGVSTPVPDDMIVDDTRAIERMMEVMPSPDASPRTPVSVEEPPRPDFDEAALESMERDLRQTDEGIAGLLVGTPPTPIQTGGYRGEFAGTPGTSVGMNPVSDGRIPLKERLFAGQEAAGGPMSGTEQLMYASALIPAAALPQLARGIGMTAAQIARYLKAGKRGEDALRQVIRQRTGAQMMRDPVTGRMIGSKDVGPFLPKPTGTQMMRDPATGQIIGRSDVGPFTKSQELLNQAQQFRQGLSQPAFKQGGNIRDKIMKTYGGM